MTRSEQTRERRRAEAAAYAWMDRPHTVRMAKGDSTLCRCGRYGGDTRGGIHLTEAPE